MELDLNRVIRIVRRWGVWLVILTIVGALSGGLLSFTRPVEYAATTTLLLIPTSPSFGVDVNQGLQTQTETYRYYLGTTPFLSEVATQLGLDPVGGVTQLQAATTTVTSQSVPTIGITVTLPDSARTTLWANTIADTFVRYIGGVEQTASGGAGSWVSVTIPEPATVPGSPVSPSRPLWTVLGGLFGFLVAATVILVIEHLRSGRTVAGRHPAALPVLAVIEALPPRPGGGSLLLEDRNESDATRGVSQLRSAVQILTAAQGIRTLGISSLQQGEGKSTVAASLAVALAEAGDRVILVDANLIAPRLGDAFGSRAARGLTSLMADPDLDLAEVVTATAWANLMFIPAGPRYDDQGLNRAAFRRAIAGIVPHADLVIFETPPLQGTPDRLQFGQSADGLLLVVGSERTRIEALRAISSAKVTTDGNVVGVVIDQGAGTARVPLSPSPPESGPAPDGLIPVGPSSLATPLEIAPRLQPVMSAHANANGNGMVRTQRAVAIPEADGTRPAQERPDEPEATA